MIIEKLDKCLDEIDHSEVVTTIQKSSISELLDILAESRKERQEKILSMLDEKTKEELKKLEEGGLL